MNRTIQHDFFYQGHWRNCQSVGMNSLARRRFSRQTPFSWPCSRLGVNVDHERCSLVNNIYQHNPVHYYQSQRCHRFYHTTSQALPQQHARSSPYAILGIPSNSSFAVVKQAFIKLALQTHPDQVGNQNGSVEKFLRIRQAFESIQHESKNGGKNAGPSGWSAEELQEWWRQETGEFLSFHMSNQTRHEVIRAYHTMGPTAGRDKGGYWEMYVLFFKVLKWFHQDSASVTHLEFFFFFLSRTFVFQKP